MKSNETTSAVMSVPEAGKKLGISRQLSYQLAARGDLPVLRLGRRLVVPRILLDRMLEGAAQTSAR